MSIIETYNESLKDNLKALYYLHSRGIKGYKDCGYLIHNYRECIVFPIYNLNNELISLELRDINNKQYYKITDKDYQGYYLFNIQNSLNDKTIFLTEGIFDCLSLLEFKLNSISGLRATLPIDILHLLSYWKNIFICFDNDDTGIEQTEKILDFMKTYYPNNNVECLDYYSKDINESLLNKELPYVLSNI